MKPETNTKIDLKTMRSLKKMVEYMWPDEERHYEEMHDEDPEASRRNHVFQDLKRVDAWLRKQDWVILETVILPHVIANDAVAELMSYAWIKHGILAADTYPQIATELPQYLEYRLNEDYYNDNDNTRKLVRQPGDKGRDFVISRMRRYIWEKLNKDHKLIARLLPQGYRSGASLK